MSFNGSGTFQINSTGQPVVTGTIISSSVFNSLTTDLANGLSTCITKDGQTNPTANIPMAGFRITGVGAPAANGDALVFGEPATVSSLVIGTQTYEVVNNGSIYGYTCSNNVTNPNTQLNISIGNCRDSTNTRGISLSTPLVKILTTNWAAGTAQGGRDVTTTIAAGQTWHVHAILNPTTMAVDILFSQSATAPTLPTGYTYFRRVMSIITGASSSAIRPFLQTGSNIQLITRGVEWSVTSNGVSTGTLRTVGVPTGFKCMTEFYYQSQGVGGSAPNPAFSGIYDPDVGVPTFGTTTQWAQIRSQFDSGGNDRYQTRIISQYTNSSAQVYTASNDTGDTIAGGVLGWFDPRDQYY